MKQKADESLKKYRELVDKPIEDGKPQFFEKKGILYRRYFGRRGEDDIVHLYNERSLQWSCLLHFCGRGRLTYGILVRFL